jgi:lipopolysaccharide/colanic/teichoic acid biosynthesis glycosyltransferase
MRVPSPTSRSRTRNSLSVWDLFWALVSPVLALYWSYVDLWQADWSVIGYYWALAAVFSLIALFAFRVQDGMTRYFSVHDALDIAEAVLFAELMTCAALFTLTRLDGIPRSAPLIHGFLLAGGVVAARIFVRVATSGGSEPADFHARRERIILIGANRFASSFIQLLGAFAPPQRPVIAVLDDDVALIGRAIAGVRILGAPHELDAIISEFAIHGIGIDRVVIAGEEDFLGPATAHEIERICNKRNVELCFLPRMIGITEPKSTTGLEWEAAKTVDRTEISAKIGSVFWFKRWIDVIGSLLLVVLLSPILILAAALVFVDVGSPVLFWQERLGWRGRFFLIYKFRTLRAPFDADGKPLTGREPSAIGRFLRETRIDELPQLFSVLFGDMSLIGPRPLLPEDQPSNTSVRLSVRPGISGWAQVNGGKLVSKDEKEMLDEWYVHNASLWTDLRIAARTVAMLLRGRLSSAESLADIQQVQNKNMGFERSIEA